MLNKDLLYSTGNYIQYLIITYNGKSLEITFIYIYIYSYYITESSYYRSETSTVL